MTLMVNQLVGFGAFISSGIIFVGSENLGTGSPVTPSYSGAGAQVGDIAFVFTLTNNGSPTAASGFTRLGADYRSPNTGTFGHCWWKVLTSGDISSPGSFTVGGSVRQSGCIIVRGGTTATAKQSIDLDAGTTIDFTGFIKAANSLGIAAFIFDDEGSTPSYPALWTNNTRYVGGTRMLSAAIVQSADYAGGASISVSVSSPSSSSQGGLLVEIT